MEYEFCNSEIKRVWDIFFWLSETTFLSDVIIKKEEGLRILSNETMMSVIKTVENIDYCCRRSTYSDAYTLVRKCRDDLMQYLFLLKVMLDCKNIDDVVLENLINYPEFLSEMIDIEKICIRKNIEAEEAVKKWIDNSLENYENKRYRDKFFDTNQYKDYLVSNDKHARYILKKYFKKVWSSESRRLNNYVHSNGKRFLSDNYKYHIEKEQKDKELIDAVQNVSDMFLSLLAVFDGTKLRSSDYLDALEMGEKPIEGSQYWVCPIIYDYMKERFEEGLFNYIKENDKYGMEF